MTQRFFNQTETNIQPWSPRLGERMNGVATCSEQWGLDPFRFAEHSTKRVVVNPVVSSYSADAEIPSFFMRERKVLGCIFNNSAAPLGPPITPLVWAIIFSI